MTHAYCFDAPGNVSQATNNNIQSTTTMAYSRSEIEESIIKQASESSAFRSRLLSDPRSVVETELGQKLPEALDIEVLEETANKIFLRLPRVVATGDELADEDLELVAGGKSSSKDTVTCGAAAAGGFASKNEIHLT